MDKQRLKGGAMKKPKKTTCKKTIAAPVRGVRRAVGVVQRTFCNQM